MTQPENQSWYYAQDNVQHGPVPFLQITNMIASGQLAVDDLVWNDTLETWIPFREVTGSVATGGLVASGDPGSAVCGTSQRLPIPQDLRRASFLKLMILSSVTIVLLVGCGAMAYFSITRVVRTSGPAGPVSAPPSPLDHFITPLTIILVMAAIGVGIWALVVAMIYVHRAWRMLQAFGASITPGIAVGLQFIPLFSLYWNFRAYHNWAREYNDIVARRPEFQLAPRPTEGVFLAFCICQLIAGILDLAGNVEESLSAFGGLFSLVSLVCFVMMFYQICNAINFFIEIRDRQAMEPGRVP